MEVHSRTASEKLPGLPYLIGCPIWACERWKGTLFTRRASRSEWLAQYSAVFNTVEGNSTFYGLPTLDALERWTTESAPGFQFALKFPRAISHEHRLSGVSRVTGAFLEVLEKLAAANRLGPSFLQLPPNFTGREWPALEAYLRSLPRDFPYALEVRHPDFFDGGVHELRLDSLLRELQIDRVLLDSRPLFSAPPADGAEAGAQQRKPKSPHRTTITGPRPFVRIIGKNDVPAMAPWLGEWAQVTAQWLDQGLTPYIFAHTPDDTFAPHAARCFHEALSQFVAGLPDFPPWPGEQESKQTPTQQRLF